MFIHLKTNKHYYKVLHNNTIHFVEFRFTKVKLTLSLNSNCKSTLKLPKFKLKKIIVYWKLFTIQFQKETYQHNILFLVTLSHHFLEEKFHVNQLNGIPSCADLCWLIYIDDKCLIQSLYAIFYAIFISPVCLCTVPV